MPLVNFDCPNNMQKTSHQLLERSPSENGSYNLAHVLFTDNTHDFFKQVWKKSDDLQQ